MAYVATIGMFDGVHRGHRFMLGTLLHEAAERGLQSAILTMDEHPQATFGEEVKLLTTTDERTNLLRETGVDEIFLFHFEIIQTMTASQFMHVLHDQCGVEVLLMGYDHQFGSDCLTHFEDYEVLAKEVGLTLVLVPVSPEGDISSSKVRRALVAGDIERANHMLGYTYRLTGEVVHGNGVGHTIGFPTANIVPEQSKLIPKYGVYAAEAICNGESFRAIVNIGTNPTVGNERETIEAYLLNYEGGDLYNQHIELRFIRRLRDEKRFDSLDDLKAQIQQDLTSL